jgi:hypothetical protein
MIFLIPSRFNILVLKKNNNYWIKYFITSLYRYEFKITGSLIVNSNYNLLIISTPYYKECINLFYNISLLLEQKNIYKIVFKRKGAWINIRSLWPYCLTLKFGYSHPVRLLYNQLVFFRYKKHLAYHVFLIIGLSNMLTVKFASVIRGARRLNVYTRRGIRFARQKLIIRKGKESQYTKLKSKIF